MPRYDFECPRCQYSIRIFQHDGDNVAADRIPCDECTERMELIGFDKDSTEELFALQLRIAELEAQAERIDRFLDEDLEIDDTDERDFNTRH